MTQLNSPPAIIGYYDASDSRGGTTRYLMELLQGLNRQQFEPVVFALEARSWHEDARSLNVPVITLPKNGMDGGKEALENDAAVLQQSVVAAQEGTTGCAPTGISTGGPTPQSSLRGNGIKKIVPRDVAWTLGQGRDCRRLARLFRQKRVDLLHTNETGSELAPLAARLAGTPRIVGTWHVDSTYDLLGERQSAKYRLLERLSMRALHAAIAVSEDTRRDWVRRCGLSAGYQKRTRVIYNGIEAAAPESGWLDLQNEDARCAARRANRARYGLPADAVIVGSLGRLAPAKGYAYLLEALARLRPMYPTLILALAGSGPEEAELRGRANHLGVGDCVHFLGFVEDTRALLSCLDVYVQPSLCETLGIAILEACAMELPVVASRIGGIPEVVVDGATGRLVEARDPAALAAGLSEMLMNPARAREMGREGRKRVLTHFTRAYMVAQTAHLYAHVLRMV